MREQAETETDAYEQAALSAIMGGGTEAQRDLGMDISRLGFGNQAALQQQQVVHLMLVFLLLIEIMYSHVCLLLDT